MKGALNEQEEALLKKIDIADKAKIAVIVTAEEAEILGLDVDNQDQELTDNDFN